MRWASINCTNRYFFYSSLIFSTRTYYFDINWKRRFNHTDEDNYDIEVKLSLPPYRQKRWNTRVTERNHGVVVKPLLPTRTLQWFWNRNEYPDQKGEDPETKQGWNDKAKCFWKRHVNVMSVIHSTSYVHWRIVYAFSNLSVLCPYGLPDV